MTGAEGFFGRRAERRLANDVLGTRHGAPLVLQVQGMPGVGKSALLRQLADDAKALGYVVRVVETALPRAARSKRSGDSSHRLVEGRSWSWMTGTQWRWRRPR